MPSANPRPYLPEDDEKLTQWANEGLTGAEMARRLGRTKNSVVGRCFRKNIKLKSSNADGPKKQKMHRQLLQQREKAVKAARSVQPIMVEEKPAITSTHIEVSVGLKLLYDLKARQCKYCVEADVNGEWLMCSAPTLDDGPYCAAHATLCFYRPAANSTQIQRKRISGFHRR